jgi:pantetheine-phosphate adenylyltransferase
MRVAWYPGSFFPWHAGHRDVLSKAIDSFDHVVIAMGVNPDKDPHSTKDKNFRLNKLKKEIIASYDAKALPAMVTVIEYKGLLKDAIENSPIGYPDAIIKGLRNAQDFEYEKVQQYWNEDLGLIIPTFYVISDRKLVHISSSAIRALGKVKK